MRKIKFRGQDGQGKWHYGDLLTLRNRICIIDPNTGMNYQIKAHTLGQYTGLKDKNGVEIFEGDVVTGLFNYEQITGYIFYGSDATFFIRRDGLWGIGLNNAEDWLTVIGNIHDNSELLGEEIE